MKAVYSEKHRLRQPKTELDGGELVTPYEKPERAEFVRQAVQSLAGVDWVSPNDFGIKPILNVHNQGYIEFLRTCWDDWLNAGKNGEAIPAVWPARGMRQVIPKDIDARLGYYSFAAETSISEGTWEAAYSGCQVALTAAEQTLQGDSAFGLCRPPGHHAASDYFGGYCFINNAAVCAQYFLDNGNERVAILDIDFHHGNGTQEIFYHRSDVHFFSLHGDPSLVFPHFLGYEDEHGVGDGEGANYNLHFGPDTSFAKWRGGLEKMLERIKFHGFDRLIVSTGVDTFEHDPISFFKLKTADYVTVGQLISSLEIPTLFLLEGGYAVDDIGTNVANILKGFNEARRDDKP